MLEDIYLRNLDDARPVTWKYGVIINPPDCGGAYYDEIEYRPHCPKCDEELETIPKYKFCPNCGQKLWWHVKYPQILESEE